MTETHTSLNKNVIDDVPMTYKECIMKALKLDLMARAVLPNDIDLVESIKNKFNDKYTDRQISNDENVQMINNPYKDDSKNKGEFYLHSNGTVVRKQAPNLFNYGKIDVLDVLHSNKKVLNAPYPNKVAINSTLEDVSRILSEKIKKTNDLTVGGSSFIECVGLVMANKFASNAYIMAKDYILHNAKHLTIDQLTRPMYVEPVFILSAAQAAYCNIVHDKYSIIRHNFINSNYERCPYVYVIMHITYSKKLDTITGLPVPKVNFNFKYDACEERPNLKQWIPKKSCVSPDPYNLPFGLRTSLKNMRVLNIMDVVKSEDNMRNINYSLNTRSLPSIYPDDLGIYACSAKKCENYAQELLDEDFNVSEYLMPKEYQKQPLLKSDIGCSINEEVIPFTYSEFNVRPFVPATESEIIKIVSNDSDHIYRTSNGKSVTDSRVSSLQYGMWDLIKPNLNKHKYATDITSDMSQYNVDNCYGRMWAFNSTVNGNADFERNDVDIERLILSKILPINGRPMIGMSYSPFIDDVM